MLDGKRYYGAFPEEDTPEARMLVSRELLTALAALEKEFRDQIEGFQREAALAAHEDETNVSVNPAKP